jgi:hypothetical protein
VRGKGQAKKGDKLFWEEKFHAGNGKAQAHTECALHFTNYYFLCDLETFLKKHIQDL